MKDVDNHIIPLPKPYPLLDSTKTPLKTPILQRFETPDFTPKENLMINHLVEVVENTFIDKMLISLKFQTKKE